MLMELPKTPIVDIRTTNNRGFTPEEVASPALPPAESSEVEEGPSIEVWLDALEEGYGESYGSLFRVHGASSVEQLHHVDFDELRGAVEKLALNDASVTVEPEASSALGNGLKCGFLGLLHMEVFHQRLTDEFNTPVLLTTPQVPYVVVDRSVPLQEGEVDLEGGGGGNVDGGFVGSVAASPADEASSSPLSSPRRYRTITSLSEWPLDEARRLQLLTSFSRHPGVFHIYSPYPLT